MLRALVRLYAGAMADHLVPPYGGVLVDGVVDDERAFELRKASTHWPDTGGITPARIII